ncbi:phage tail protein [Bisgaard Taxon 10/6]|uniref:phage tail protein n=1 Tax=Exercitatus varius TaxID=67857 RepID=UPI00294AC089|nr:phage tail protein [Exercitatus varius]MDG2959895.1 phage tail protein [Exercitatus varius]
MANLILTPEWTEGIYQLETSDLIIGGPDGVDNRQAIQLGKRTEYLKQEVEKCAPSASPAFTGTPTAPTASQTVNDTTIATTAFVKAAIADLVGSAPATLDTLAEIATALGNDGKIKEVLLAEIAKKANATDFTTLKELLIGIPFPYPLAAVPSGCLAFNGQAFNKATYPILAQKYPSGVLPDLRGEFIRGWGNGRGVDAGRGLLSAQGDAIRNITGWLSDILYQDVSFLDNADGALRRDKTIVNLSYSAYNSGSSTDVSGSMGIQGGYSTKTGDRINLDASLVVPTADENRPRNIAFQYICLAK